MTDEPQREARARRARGRISHLVHWLQAAREALFQDKEERAKRGETEPDPRHEAMDLELKTWIEERTSLSRGGVSVMTKKERELAAKAADRWPYGAAACWYYRSEKEHATLLDLTLRRLEKDPTIAECGCPALVVAAHRVKARSIRRGEAIVPYRREVLAAFDELSRLFMEYEGARPDEGEPEGTFFSLLEHDPKNVARFPRGEEILGEPSLPDASPEAVE